MEHDVPVLRRGDRGGRGAQEPQSNPVLLLVLHRRLRTDARPAGRGHLHGQSSHSSHRRPRSGFASVRGIHAPDLLELEQRIPRRCRKRDPDRDARYDGARRGRKGGDVAQPASWIYDCFRARHPLVAFSPGRRGGDQGAPKSVDGLRRCAYPQRDAENPAGSSAHLVRKQGRTPDDAGDLAARTRKWTSSPTAAGRS